MHAAQLICLAPLFSDGLGERANCSGGRIVADSAGIQLRIHPLHAAAELLDALGDGPKNAGSCVMNTAGGVGRTQVGPPKPPSPVPEGVEEEASPARGAHRTGDAAFASQRVGDSGSRDRERSLESQLFKVCHPRCPTARPLCVAVVFTQGRNQLTRRYRDARPAENVKCGCAALQGRLQCCSPSRSGLSADIITWSHESSTPCMRA